MTMGTGPMSDPSRTAVPPRFGVEWAAVAISFLVYSVVAAPLPALNEPHYLAKAKHFWNPAWCAGDLFLESANAHTVFYVVIGWITLFLPLEAVAWIGRLTSLTLLAGGWTGFTRRLLPQPGTAFAAAWIFLGLQAVGNWSGEWVIGGVESKVYTFAALFWAAAWALDGRLLRAATAYGVGIAFHPVIGLWTLFAVIGACLVGWAVPAMPREKMVGKTHPTKSEWLFAVVILVLTALPGLIPVVQLLTAPVDPMVRYAGTYLQVYHRLAHHLDPMLFPRWAYIGYGWLILIWMVGAWLGPRSTGWQWLHGVTGWAIIFALAGVAAGYGPRPPQLMPGYDWRMHLLKFYPFRLADAFLPMVVAWLVAWWLTRWSKARVIGALTLYVLIPATLLRSGSLAQAERYQASQDADWIEACRWIRDHTPSDSLILTPHFRWTFKWYGERPEYANYKDCPQDPKSIVEWNRRLLLLTKRFQDGFADELYTWDELQSLRSETGITHVITDRLGPMDFPPVYRNATFRVYDLTGNRPPAE